MKFARSTISPHDVQVRRLLQVEHLGRPPASATGERCMAKMRRNGVRLQLNVVIHEQDLLAVGVFQRLVHHPAVSAGTAEVGLSWIDSRSPKRLSDSGKSGWSRTLDVP